MPWRCYLLDTMDGLLGAEVEVPSFSWSVSVSDCSFDSTTGKGTGENEASVVLPWTALPGDTPAERAAEVATGRRGLTLCWDDGVTLWPVVWGAIGERTDTFRDTSFSLDSATTLLGYRYCLDSSTFGVGTTTDDDGNEVEGVTTSSITISGMSLRGIAATVGQICTDEKEGGTLPIDWGYAGEDGDHERTYWGYNVANISCSGIFEKLANVSGGPDLQLRPYLLDEQHVRLQLVAGSDEDVYIGLDEEPHFIASYNDLTVYHSAPVMRVYQTGAGDETAQLCALAEDMELATKDENPYPLREMCASDVDDDSLEEVQAAADGTLAAYSTPLCQIEVTTDLAELPIGEAWPGERFQLAIEGFPTLPDGIYTLRLMEMSGDEGRMVTLTFDPIEDPTY